MARAVEESEGIDTYDYIVVNDKLEDCIIQINTIVASAHQTPANNEEFVEEIKNELKANGFNEIANYFDLYKERQDEEAFFYNVQMGLESKANNKSHFYPKSFEESCIEIKSCLKHKRCNFVIKWICFCKERIF